MTEVSAAQSSFLVTCIGAYDDSGIGTGGFVCVHDGRATVIDKIDSTGLCESGGMVYRYARGLRALLGYTADGLLYSLKTPEARDIHDVVVRDGRFVCVATGTNEVLWLDPFGRVERRWQAKGERDAWHLNCLCEKDGRLFLTAFGRFDQHRGWVGQCTGTGFVIDLESGDEVLGGLNGPHNPRYIDGQWFVCDSHVNALAISDGKSETRRIPMAGFTRGLAYDEQFLYVGESANRKANPPSDCSSIAVVDRKTLEVVRRIEIPFPEIYEIVIVSSTLAGAMTANPAKFQLGESSGQLNQLEKQVEISRKEIENLNRRLEPLLRLEYLRGRLVQLKRRLVG